MAESKKLDLLTTEQVAEYTHMSASFFEKRRSYKKSPAYLKSKRWVNPVGFSG
jgi:hypothetical protein